MSAPAMVDAMKQVATKSGQNRAVVQGHGVFNPRVKVTEDGRIIFNRTKAGTTEFPNLQFWDYVKRELDHKAFSKSGGDDPALLKQLSRQLRDELDSVVPEYAKVRADAKRFFDADNAYEAGQKFVMLNDDLSMAKKTISGMSEAEKKLFRQGFAMELRNNVMRMSEGRNTLLSRVFNSPMAMRKIRLALGQAQAKKLEAFLHAEHAMQATHKALQGSDTKRNFSDAAMAGGGYWMATGDLTGASQAALVGFFTRRAGRKASQLLNQKLANEVTDLLLSPDPAALEKLAKRANQNNRILIALRKFEVPTALGWGLSKCSATSTNDLARVPACSTIRLNQCPL